MFTSRHRHQVIASIAFLAVLMASLMPTLSHAVNAARDGGLAGEICSADPARRQASIPRTGESDPADTAVHFKHCAFCLIHADASGLPPTSASVQFVRAQALRPSLFAQPRPALVTAWTNAQPRAPPIVA